jgi:hypothetical protein
MSERVYMYFHERQWLMPALICLCILLIVVGCEMQTKFERRSSETPNEAIVKEVVLSDGTRCAYVRGYGGLTCNWLIVAH